MKMKYRIQNFKAFADTGELQLAPITVFCGANSSGKSSVLKSLLLVKQSAAERRSAMLSNAPAQPLLLNGEWTRLGSWTATVHGHRRDEPIKIGWETESSLQEAASYSGLFAGMYPFRSDLPPIKMRYEVDIRSDQNEREELSSYLHTAKLISESCTITITAGSAKDSRDGQYQISTSNIGSMIRARELSRRSVFVRSGLEISKILSKYEGEIPLGHVNVALAGPFIANVRAVLDSSWLPFLDRLIRIARGQRKGKPGPNPKWLIQFEKSVRNYREVISRHDETDIIFDFEVGDVGTMIQYLVSDTNAYFEHLRNSASPLYARIRYLGPLRYQPQRFYQFDDTGGVDIGVSGEYTVQVLALERNSTVHLNQLETALDGSITFDHVEYLSLLDATNYWLGKMGLPDVTTSPLWQSLYELKLGQSGHALPDVGFGVSQVLPIIVECLRAQKGDTVLLEQPEIHLHPSIQAILADFFLERSLEGIRFIVETHSEYMIKRLCRRIAERTIEGIAQLTSIFFVSQDSRGDAECSSIQMNDFGEIVNWPKGFFDNAEDMYWAKASLKRRAAMAKATRQ